MHKAHMRLKKELRDLAERPPEGIACYQKNDSIQNLVATILGPVGSPYEGGIFKLDVDIDDGYPFAPPSIRFVTPVYHPNIDNGGRICMDLLKMPPNGGWNPTITLQNLFEAVKCLLEHPNPDDPLMPDIATEYRFEKSEFEKKARLITKEHASS